MKKSDFRMYDHGTAEYVVLHAKWREQRGRRGPSEIFRLRNPREALALASRCAYFPLTGKYLENNPLTEYYCHQCGVFGVQLWRVYKSPLGELLCSHCVAQKEGGDIASLADGNHSLIRVKNNPGRQTNDWHVPAIPTEAYSRHYLAYYEYGNAPTIALKWWRALPTLGPTTNENFFDPKLSSLYAEIKKNYFHGSKDEPMLIRVGKNRLMELNIFPYEKFVSFGLFLPEHLYSRKTFCLTQHGYCFEDKKCVVPEIDRTDREPDFSPITNVEILDLVTRRLADQIMLKRLITKFGKKMVRITHTSKSIENREGLFKMIHAIPGTLGTFDMELENGSRYQFVPEIIGSKFVDGPLTAFCGGRRKIQIIRTA